jgi:methyl-accepting chemotaxis protein PixJ
MIRVNNPSQNRISPPEPPPFKSKRRSWRLPAGLSQLIHLKGENNTLFRQLLFYVLPMVLVPLAAASGINYLVIQNRTTNEALLNLRERSTLTAKTTTTFLNRHREIEKIIVSNPTILQFLRSTAQKAEADGLPQRPIEQLEREFSATKVLDTNIELNRYLANVKQTSQLGEVFFTERHGYNIAASNLTSDFFQADEKWWQTASGGVTVIDDPKYDDSAFSVVIALSHAIKDPQSGEFLGVIKSGILVKKLNEILSQYFGETLQDTAQVQIVDTGAEATINTLTSGGLATQQQPVTGGKTMIEAAAALVAQAAKSDRNLQELLSSQPDLRDIQIHQATTQELASVSLRYQDRVYNLTYIQGTDWVAIASTETAQINAAGRDLFLVFMGTALVLGGLALWCLVHLARRFSKPISDLTQTAQLAATGDFDVKATPRGTVETQTLANSFNNLVAEIKSLLLLQKLEAEDQRQQRESLEQEIFQILDEVGDATTGDLTVRATLTAGEMGTVADLFNAVVENLRDIAIQVKQSAGQVNHSLTTNESSIRDLSTLALTEVESIRNTLGSVQKMSESVQDVAVNARQAAAIASDTFQTVQASTTGMEQTVNSILQLRQTISATAEQMQRLGESSQKIAQVVSLIDEIALKTSLLAINASVEAKRAGEQGQGFAAVASQVGALAEQSAAATRDIAAIVASIQTETQGVTAAMEQGITQVAESTQSVETTKQTLEQILQRSQEINQLMQSISTVTVAQSDTSKVVANLIQRVTEAAETRFQSSHQLAESMQAAAQIAQELEASVDQFKVS